MAMWLQMFIFIFGLIGPRLVCKAQYNMYEGDCLDYYVTDDISEYTGNLDGKQHQIIPFCYRDLVSRENFEVVDGVLSAALSDLHQENTTIEQLYSWSAHVDLIEDYQAYRQDPNEEPRSVFYNCSSKSTFGRFCQYSFDSQKPFHVLVKEALTTNHPVSSMTTCYRHLNCTRGAFVWCLDWREVCDGKVDCWPKPVDESNCERLEENECGSNEYRCFNGQCIPGVFLKDDGWNPDCLDRTDEDLGDSILQPSYCQEIKFVSDHRKAGDPAFRCTDISCNHWTQALTYDGSNRCGTDALRSQPIETFERQLLSLTANAHISNECWATMICHLQVTSRVSLDDILHAHLFNGSCENVCSKLNQSCPERMVQHCPSLFEFPAMAIGWKQAHLVYRSNQTTDSSNHLDYLCYDEEYCSTSPPVIRFKKVSDPSIRLACELFAPGTLREDWVSLMPGTRKALIRQCSSRANTGENNCSNPTQFSCGKRCLSKHRLRDNLNDCSERSDEVYNDSCSLQHKHRMVCSSTHNNTVDFRCLPSTSVGLGVMNTCRIDDKPPHFPILCDGHLDIDTPVQSHYGVDTDESHCERWQCDNQYTRCDGIWNCSNGADEAQCFHPVCQGLIRHPCILRNTSEFICLPLRHANDRVIDCFGATDERSFCREKQNGQLGFLCFSYRSDQQIQDNQVYTCADIDQLCWDDSTCLAESEKPRWLCQHASGWLEIHCSKFRLLDRRIRRENVICTLDDTFRRHQVLMKRMPHFSLANYSIMPPLYQPSSRSFSPVPYSPLNFKDSPISLKDLSCRGGVPILFHGHRRCLCPPTLYGPFCEDQRERVSVSIQIGAPEWRTPFILVAYLVDDRPGVINSYHFIRYLSIRDCAKKFHFHLLYSSRPKLIHSTYSVRIDAFEMSTLNYRGSWSFAIVFSFLPVYRLPLRLTILVAQTDSSFDCRLRCHPKGGQCLAFVNTGQRFCHCRPGWSGPLCSEPYQDDCSPDSFCAGTSNNRSICVCPTEKHGRRCHLPNQLCEEATAKQCLNGGRCIPVDPRISTNERTTCSCAEQFDGDRCQWNETRIHIDFAIPNLKDSVHIHFITVNSHPPALLYQPTRRWGPHERSTTFQRIPFDRDIVTIFWSKPFHLVFVEHDEQIYWVFTQLNYMHRPSFLMKVEVQHRCPSIMELLDEQIVRYPRLRRVKYYHVPCEQQVDIRCFHDDDQYLCLCTHDRRANCFIFDHQMQSDCQQLSFCENGGRCFQNTVKCPTAALCACPACYMGRRCLLSTKGFGLPLDVILGYQVRPGVAFFQQPASVINTGWITLIIFLIGVINGLFSLLTFRRKDLRKIGSGNYLFAASINSLPIIMMFLLKYLLLVLTQLIIRHNRLFVLVQCVSLDFALKICLQIGDWLYACTVIERLVSAWKGIHFQPDVSRKSSLFMIGIISIVMIGTLIHEPLHRTLIDDVEEGRVWCIVRYASASSTNFFNQLTSISTVIHLICPFGLNLISAMGIILLQSRRRSKIGQKLIFREHLLNQLRQQKYSIISPIVLILTAIPRLILTFQLECMKSARDPVSIFLFAYFISFLPSILLFAIFVLPSTVYKREFQRVTHPFR